MVQKQFSRIGAASAKQATRNMKALSSPIHLRFIVAAPGWCHDFHPTFSNIGVGHRDGG
jgi:hypothetical protein